MSLSYQLAFRRIYACCYNNSFIILSMAFTPYQSIMDTFRIFYTAIQVHHLPYLTMEGQNTTLLVATGPHVTVNTSSDFPSSNPQE